MIYQISPVQTKTQSLSNFNKGLIQARHIQARLKEIAHHAASPEIGFRQVSSLVPSNLWFD